MRRLALLLTAMTFTGALSAPNSLAGARQTITIGGNVYYRQMGLDGVKVRAWIDGRPGPDDTTENGGEYSITISGANSVSRVEFTHRDYDPGEDLHLSGLQSHRISKQLYKPGEARPSWATLETLSAFRSWLVFTINDPSLREQVVELGLFEKLMKLPVDAGKASGFLQGDKATLVRMYQTLLGASPK